MAWNGLEWLGVAKVRIPFAVPFGSRCLAFVESRLGLDEFGKLSSFHV